MDKSQVPPEAVIGYEDRRMSKSGTPGDLTPRGCCWSALCCHTKNTEGSHFNDKSFVLVHVLEVPAKGPVVHTLQCGEGGKSGQESAVMKATQITSQKAEERMG